MVFVSPLVDGRIGSHFFDLSFRDLAQALDFFACLVLCIGTRALFYFGFFWFVLVIAWRGSHIAWLPMPDSHVMSIQSSIISSKNAVGRLFASFNPIIRVFHSFDRFKIHVANPLPYFPLVVISRPE